MKITIETPRGVYKTCSTVFSDVDIERVSALIEKAASGKLLYMRLDTTRGPVYFGKDVLVNSVFIFE